MKHKILISLLAAGLFLTACNTANDPQEKQTENTENTIMDTTAQIIAELPDEPLENPLYFTWDQGNRVLISTNAWAARVFVLSDGRLLGGYETHDGIHTRISDDMGQTWYNDTIASFYPELQCANINFYQDGDVLYMAYRATIKPEEGQLYTSLRVSVSYDLGKTWADHSLICEYRETEHGPGGVWEPYLGKIGDALTCFYANDSRSVTDYQNIESLTWDGKKWTDRRIISDGNAHQSRDGMPVWIPLREGGYALAIESTHKDKLFHPFMIQLLYSEDGIHWSEPWDIYTPITLKSKAGAPGIAQLPNGQIVLSFQTDELATEKGDSTSVMKTIISDGTPFKYLKRKNFTKSDNVFDTPDGQASVWTGIHYKNGILYAAGGTWTGAEFKWYAFPEWTQTTEP